MAGSNFLASLQQNGLFTDDNPNPLRPPRMDGYDPVELFRRLFPLVQEERQKDRQLQLDLARSRVPQLANTFAQPQLKPQPGETPNVVFDRRGDSADTFVNNILNPPERGFKFQELNQKRNLAEAGLDIKRGDQDIRQQRADVYEFKARNPNLHTLMPKGGNVMFYDPLTGDLKDSGVSTGSLSEEDKIKLQGKQQINAIQERGTQSRQTEGVKGENTLKAIRERGSQTRETNTTRPTTAPSANQERIGQNNAARKLINTRPDLKEFISFDPQGNFVIDPKTPLNELSMIKSELYPKGDIKLGPDNKPLTQERWSPTNTTITQEQAIQELKKHGLQPTPENIKKAMDPNNYKNTPPGKK